VAVAFKIGLPETRLMGLEDSPAPSGHSYATYYDLQIRLIEAEIAECDARIDSFRYDDEGRRVGDSTGTSLGETSKKKAKLLNQKLVMRNDHGFVLDEMALADSGPLFGDWRVPIKLNYDSLCDSDSGSDLGLNSNSDRSVQEQTSNDIQAMTSEAWSSCRDPDRTQGAEERQRAVNQDVTETRIQGWNRQRIRSTIYNSIVFSWIENGRSCTLADALDPIVFPKVVIRHIRRAWTDREDIMDDRYARNRIQTSS
jgi:hypothetical protein